MFRKYKQVLIPEAWDLKAKRDLRAELNCLNPLFMIWKSFGIGAMSQYFLWLLFYVEQCINTMEFEKKWHM